MMELPLLFDEPIQRATQATPTQSSHKLYTDSLKEHRLDSITPSRASPDFYDTASQSTGNPLPDTPLSDPDKPGGGLGVGPNSMDGDASGGMPDSPSMPDRSRTGSGRRGSRPQSASAHRQQPGPRPQQSSSPHAYPIASPPSSSDSGHNAPSGAGFQGSSIHYSSGTMPYNQRPGYVGQYTMSSQPSLTMAHTPPPPFAYSHTFHHPGVPDSSMISSNIHASYQPMLQPHAPVFPYQRHSPEGGSASHASFSGSRSSPIYGHHQVNTSPPSNAPMASSSQGQSSAHSPSYVGPSPFHSLRYPSSISTSQYTYPAQSFPGSPPMYQSQYGPAPYPQHFSPPQEAEPQGTWWYMPHATPVPSQAQYDSSASYQGHYQIPYSPIAHQEVEGSYPAAPTSPSAQSTLYPVSPVRQGVASAPASPLPHPTGLGPPLTQLDGTSASSSSGRNPVSDSKPVVRRSYHPNPPAHRSEWVMWSGNVPSDATHDELWRFFNQPPDRNSPGESRATGVMSIFLISRSSCAFVNFETEAHLDEAIARFNGKPLRPSDPRCPRLVCRVRRKDDDLKAGVGGQRGMGMHTRWIKELKEKERAASEHSDMSASDDPPASPSSASENLANVISTVSLSSDEEGRQHVHVKHSSSSGSYTSTNSSILTKYFPKRYFILKSLTQYDLDLSVETSLWATQKHNEGILDQAFRTSKDVYLVFSVNKSGEFYGYARMVGPVRRGEHRVSWASRTTDSESPPARSEQSPLTGRNTTNAATISPIRLGSSAAYFSPSDGRQVDNSPMPVDAADAPFTLPDEQRTPGGQGRIAQSAPAELGQPHHKFTIRTPVLKHSTFDQLRLAQAKGKGKGKGQSVGDEGFELDAAAPVRAMRSNQGPPPATASSPVDGQDKGRPSGASVLQAVEEEEEKGEDAPEGGKENREVDGATREETWGDCFKVQWLCTDRLPFYRTRHIRNPWNHDREVKVSRDGTELEPTVGERLLDEWERLAEPQQQPPPVGAGKLSGSSKKGKAATAPAAAGGAPASAESVGGGGGGPSRS